MASGDIKFGIVIFGGPPPAIPVTLEQSGAAAAKPPKVIEDV
jgi:hypothetical protein